MRRVPRGRIWAPAFAGVTDAAYASFLTAAATSS